MIDRTDSRPHAELNICSLQRRTGSGCAGDHAVFIAQYHFAVGTDVHQQGGRILFVKLCGKQAAHGIRAHITPDVGNNQQSGEGTNWQNLVTGNRLRLCQNRRKGDLGQIFRTDPQKQLLHGRISNNGDHPDLFRENTGFVTNSLNQFGHSITNQGS